MRFGLCFLELRAKGLHLGVRGDARRPLGTDRRANRLQLGAQPLALVASGLGLGARARGGLPSRLRLGVRGTRLGVRGFDLGVRRLSLDARGLGGGLRGLGASAGAGRSGTRGDDLGLRGRRSRSGFVALAGDLPDAIVAGLPPRRSTRLGRRAALRLGIALGLDGCELRECLRALGLLGLEAGDDALALGLLGGQPRQRALALRLRRLDLRQRALVLGDVLGLDARELRERVLACFLGRRQANSEPLAFEQRVDRLLLGFLDPGPELVRTLDEILEPGVLG